MVFPYKADFDALGSENTDVGWGRSQAASIHDSKKRTPNRWDGVRGYVTD